MDQVSIYWMRRDLRLDDNKALSEALKSDHPVLPIFIFDKHILGDLKEDDARVTFLYRRLKELQEELQKDYDSSIKIIYDTPKQAFESLLKEYAVQAVFTNRDYEPYAKERDSMIKEMLEKKDIPFYDFKDQVIFEKDEIKNGSGEVYKVFTPYSKNWLSRLSTTEDALKTNRLQQNFYPKTPKSIPSLKEMGFKPSSTEFPSRNVNEKLIKEYGKNRDFPAMDATSRLGMHLRFGTISIRKLVKKAQELDKTFLNELIWREFYMMILDAFPEVVDKAFKPQYDKINWRNDEKEFKAWCEGKTGYPMVDAGMRQMNAIGYMHNRVRMVTASFLTKHLLIDWRWGEAYFAEKLLDYELSSNNGGWQWAAGSGTDAQPYFRVFNPESQLEKFDKNREYVKKWIPEFGTDKYPQPIVEHKFARERALEEFKKAVK
ncbi:deoxyribodipyrimidine photo-lyase [Litoribacter alkaliphilus]|uniref:Deoxyribodipyrimidine photo-lyase n=1 Tax=Litoribacter ruber TaxID=702568 RepID=A0AAP2G0N1_9BACT|nr:deoxyribodipyrimidine photo-lyase [Litoribacter alkaliphilus]MBS9522622.1 deoxyribodipyrimidine photo-lyase [Litoribacter alkaliphilus]